MAEFEVQAPDGSLLVVEGPDDATDEQIIAAATEQFAGLVAQEAQAKEQATADAAASFQTNARPGGAELTTSTATSAPEPVEFSGTASRFLVGAGREFSTVGRGVVQGLANIIGDEEFEASLAQEEANEREIYADLDDQGFGAEDFGELAAFAPIFMGKGGVLSISSRAGAFAGLRATTTTGAEARAERLEDALQTGISIGAVGAIANRAVTIFRAREVAGVAATAALDAVLTGGLATGGRLLRGATNKMRTGIDKLKKANSKVRSEVNKDLNMFMFAINTLTKGTLKEFTSAVAKMRDPSARQAAAEQLTGQLAALTTAEAFRTGKSK